MKYQTFLMIALILFSSACGPRSSLSNLDIFGGAPVAPSDQLAVVAIADNEGLYCTGTALTPLLIVTAAHCVMDEKLEDVRIYVGPGEEGRDVKGQYTITKMGFSNRFDRYDSESSFDVGYMVLSKPLDLPKDSYAKVLSENQDIKELIVKGSESLLVGFGAREDKGYGLKYSVTSSIRKVLANEIKIGAEGKDACQGDSGGPAFGRLKSGEWKLYGIASRGIDCGNGGFWGLLHRSICWVQKDSGVNLDLRKGLCGQ